MNMFKVANSARNKATWSLQRQSRYQYQPVWWNMLEWMLWNSNQRPRSEIYKWNTQKTTWINESRTDSYVCLSPSGERKFSQKWLGPYTVMNISDKGVVTLKNASGVTLKNKYNIVQIKHYIQELDNKSKSTSNEQSASF